MPNATAVRAESKLNRVRVSCFGFLVKGTTAKPLRHAKFAKKLQEDVVIEISR